MNCTLLKYCQNDGLLKELFRGLIPTEEIQKTMNDLIIQVWQWCIYQL